MDHLFNRLDGAYPHKWRSNFANQQVIDNWMESWVEAFEEEGITPADVKNGLKECRRRFTWPPSCAEFIQACKPPLDPLKAYYEAVAGVQARINGEMGEWSHPAIYWAAMPMAVELREQSFSQIKARWEAALTAQMEKGSWEPIKQPMKQIAAPGKSRTSPEDAAQRLRELGATNIIKDHRGGDMRGWAKRLLEREAAGEALLPIQRQFAREALNIKPEEV